MSFRKDNDAYEAWLATQCDVVKKDVTYKHHRMTKSAFIFLRATYFRWAKQIGKLCPELMDAPQVLGVGDMHLENFGTWRDADGRLVWGVNDFDEAAIMPYPLDLVRLAASIRLAPKLRVGNSATAEALLKGYRAGLDQPQPALLYEGETWLRPYAERSDDKPEKFWKEVADYPKAKPPAKIAKQLIASLPKDIDGVRLCSRVAGGGSLGRPRYVAVAFWRGGQILREAKALVPSAWTYVHGGKSRASHFLEIANGRYRAPDPFLEVHDKFIFRRLAADSRRIELGPDAGAKLKAELFRAMGFDLASIHAAGSPGAAALRADLKKRPRGWLNAAAKAMVAAVERDYEGWRN
ncbi:MAG: hypothetical protein JWR80_8647 [Bradyrhizobium sp.]|nr:hypothetical protein [Bradyrhizobium sp.]